MLLSMTGYGDSQGQSESFSFRFEVRSVNNRHLKLILRAPEPYNLLELEFEKVVRKYVRRGTILIQLRLDRKNQAEDFKLNQVALMSYAKQIREAFAGAEWVEHRGIQTLYGQILALPGVCIEHETSLSDAESEWPVLERGMNDALTRMQKMREEEGGRMARQLAGYKQDIAEQLAIIRDLQPSVAVSYRERLRERVQVLLNEVNARVSDAELIREVALYAERSDIAEEVTRLSSHLVQFGEVLQSGDESPGRKLEFVIQEMGREVNTIGSKAGDVAISRRVVEIKAVLEKVRELLQNVE